MRMFVAVIPPTEAIEHLDEFLASRREAGPFRWTAAEQLHLTLAFTEDLPDYALDEALERLTVAASKRAKGQPIQIAGGGALPHPDRAKVVVADVRTDLDELARLARGCRNALATAGARVDGQRFSPHVTVARTGRPTNVTNWVRLLDSYEGPEWPLDEIALVASHLGEGPRKRPRHEVLARFDLGA